MNKISVHIDGFNLYHAIDNLTKVNPALNYLKWISLKGLINEFVKGENKNIVSINFYSAYPIHKTPEVLSRHKIFVKAQLAEGINFVEGQFKKKSYNGYDAKGIFGPRITHEEKETDVNIAINIIKDASAH